MENPAVTARDLVKIYDPTPYWMRLLIRSSSKIPVVALDHCTFSVDRGQVCAVIGPNGAGKSTLFRILTGLTTSSNGQVTVLDMDPALEGHRLRRHIGFMPAEDRTLFLRHSSLDNLRFHGRLQGIEESRLKKRIETVLKMVDLWNVRERDGFALSSGMRARLMLARAILHEPKVLILDEPTGAIDPLGAQAFVELIKAITEEQKTATLLSSHRLEEIDTLRDNILLLDYGRVVFRGDLDRVRTVVEQKIYEVLCINPLAASRVAGTLRQRLGPLARVVQEGCLVTAPLLDGSPTDLAWLGDFGDQVETVSFRKLSLHETIAALLEGSGR